MMKKSCVSSPKTRRATYKANIWEHRIVRYFPLHCVWRQELSLLACLFHHRENILRLFSRGVKGCIQALREGSGTGVYVSLGLTNKFTFVLNYMHILVNSSELIVL
jgi:hypothetical protein